MLSLNGSQACDLDAGVKANRARHLPPAITRAEKRKLYTVCPVTVQQIPSWNNDLNYKKVTSRFPVNQEINDKISVWNGDITQLEIDAIVNGANHDLQGGAGGSVNGAIHKAAGPGLIIENTRLLRSCPTGEARVAAGYRLPAWFVIHTNGPTYCRDPANAPFYLAKCYENCLAAARNNNLRTVAFPSISTGHHGYPPQPAAEIAVATVRKWLEVPCNRNSIDRIIFCIFDRNNLEVYYNAVSSYFPRQTLGKDAAVRANRARYLPPAMNRTEKRKLYTVCPVTLQQIPSWNADPNYKRVSSCYPVNQEINSKISVWKGDITQLEIDAVVNGANHHLQGGTGVDGAIHKAAGPDLLTENTVLLKGCPTGEARVAAGYRLPAWYIIHTNGPIYNRDQRNAPHYLAKCYENCLEEVRNNGIRSVAFPNISTGVFGYPLLPAAEIAVGTVRKWLEDPNNRNSVDRIIFCIFDDNNLGIYYDIIPKYFPRQTCGPGAGEAQPLCGSRSPVPGVDKMQSPCRKVAPVADNMQSPCRRVAPVADAGNLQSPCRRQSAEPEVDKMQSPCRKAVPVEDAAVRANRARHLPPAMTRAEKHSMYTVVPVTLEEITPWNTDHHYKQLPGLYPIDDEINSKVSVWNGDITQLEIDAVVNGSSENARGGSGVDIAIHDAAGPDLLAENTALFKGCPTTEARVTAGYRLPAWYVIHTNGPMDKDDASIASRDLANCYQNSLTEARKNKIKTIAFPCISTGMTGYNPKPAADIAVGTVRKWLQDPSNRKSVSRIIFCIYDDENLKIYYDVMSRCFPRETGGPDWSSPAVLQATSLIEDSIGAVNKTQPCQDVSAELYKAVMLDRSRNLPPRCKRAVKRAMYKGCFVTLEEIPSWDRDCNYRKSPRNYPVKNEFNSLISVWKGDITQLEVDAIVNGVTLDLKGGQVNEAIHKAAGPWLDVENSVRLESCPPGEARAAAGYSLPAWYVIYTNGPICNRDPVHAPETLARCYESCLAKTARLGIKSVAFPCISTGKAGFPAKKAAQIAVATVRRWLEDPDNRESISRIIFCVFDDENLEAYYDTVSRVFPRT